MVPEKDLTAAGAMLALPMAFGVGLVLVAYEIFAKAYCAAMIWTWFAVPVGMPIEPRAAFYGFFLLLAVTRLKRPESELKDERSSEQKAIAILATLAAPWLLLALGWWFRP